MNIARYYEIKNANKNLSDRELAALLMRKNKEDILKLVEKQQQEMRLEQLEERLNKTLEENIGNAIEKAIQSGLSNLTIDLSV